VDGDESLADAGVAARVRSHAAIDRFAPRSTRHAIDLFAAIDRFTAIQKLRGALRATHVGRFTCDLRRASRFAGPFALERSLRSRSPSFAALLREPALISKGML
jgi:hypothetical protein